MCDPKKKTSDLLDIIPTEKFFSFVDSILNINFFQKKRYVLSVYIIVY